MESTRDPFLNRLTSPRGYRNRWKFHPIVSHICVSAVINDVRVRVFFKLTDRVSIIPSNIPGCQSGTWSAGQEILKTRQRNINKLQLEHENENNKKKGTITQSTCQKKIEERHSIDRVWHTASRKPSDATPHTATISHLHPKA